MPYEKRGLCIYKQGESEPLKCHETEEQAKAHLAALNMAMMDESQQLWLEAKIKPNATEGFEGREWEVTIIGPKDSAGVVTINKREYIRSLNGRLYSVEAIRESVPMWNGVKVFDNHLTDEEFQQRQGMRSVAKEWLGSIVQPWFEEGAKQLRGIFKVAEEALATKLLKAHNAGILSTIGLSIDTYPVVGQEQVLEGQRWPTIEGFKKILSVDLVAEPAAGGGFNRLIAANSKSQLLEATKMEDEAKQLEENRIQALEEKLTALEKALAAKEQPELEEQPEEEAPAEAVQQEQPETSPAEEVINKVAILESRLTLRDKLDTAKLPDHLRRMVEAQFIGRGVTSDEMDKAIKLAKDAQAASDPTGRVQGSGDGRQPVIEVGMSEQDKAEAAFLRLVMGNNVFRGLENNQADYVQERIPESYRSWVKYGREIDGYRRLSNLAYDVFGGNPLTEAVSTASMTSIVKNALNVMTAASYSKRHLWWEPLVRVEEVDTIDQATLVRLYGMNTLAVVNEGGPYTELPWTDEEETASFVKKGNYVGVTLETLLNDKLNVIRTIPDRLATSWYNTISALVSGVFTVNSATGPILGTSGALFNATATSSAGGHANLLTAALSYTAFSAARLAMLKQTDQTLGAGQKLLIEPRYVLVPVDLETTALQIRNSEMLPGSGNNDVNPFYQKFDIIKVPNWTDATDWALVGDPGEFPAIWLIFLRGQQVPQLFTADQDTSGAMFTNDELRYKVRMMTWRFSATYDCAPVADFRPLHKSNVAG